MFDNFEQLESSLAKKESKTLRCPNTFNWKSTEKIDKNCFSWLKQPNVGLEVISGIFEASPNQPKLRGKGLLTLLGHNVFQNQGFYAEF